MKKIKKYLCAAVAVMMLFLTGCGTELYELTEDEEKLIIHSAAYLVAKHNIQQKDGVNGYPLPDSFDEEESETESETETESEQETESENAGGSGTGSGNQKPSEDMITFAELIGQKGKVEISYEGSVVTNSYQEGSAYIVDAQKGKTFYVMKFKLTNTTDKEVTVDNEQKSIVVRLVSDAVKVRSEVTFLSMDFSTYKGTIKAGESVETILLFEVSESVVEKIKTPKLQVTIGKTTKTIKL